LAVKRAEPGSLDIELLFGGLYTVITSQPVSFALNFADLLGYGRLAVKAILPGDNEETTEVVFTSQSGSYVGVRDGQTLLVPTPHGPLVVPDDFSVDLEMDFPDGTRLSLSKPSADREDPTSD